MVREMLLTRHEICQESSQGTYTDCSGLISGKSVVAPPEVAGEHAESPPKLSPRC